MPRDTVFLLPGLLCDAGIWRHQVEALALAHEVRVADFTAFDSLSRMAVSVLEAAPDRFSLAGHSMGARVALEIMRRAPERVDRLALLDTGVHPPRPGEAEQRRILVDLVQTSGMQALAERWLPPMVHSARHGEAAIMAPLQQMVLRMSPEIFRRQVRALLNRADATDVLRTITCPVLIAVGELDQWSPPAQHEAIARLIPQARYVVFPGSGHMSPIETPEAVSSALIQWLA